VELKDRARLEKYSQNRDVQADFALSERIGHALMNTTIRWKTL